MNHRHIASPATAAAHKLLSRDLFAKSISNKIPSNHSKPFLIVISGNLKRTRWYSNAHEFLKHLEILVKETAPLNYSNATTPKYSNATTTPNSKTSEDSLDSKHLELLVKETAPSNYSKATTPKYSNATTPKYSNATTTPNSKTSLTFWVDIDFSHLTPEQYNTVCNLLRFHDVTIKDCFIEDTTVTDTKVSVFDTYLFCIVDTLLENNNKTWCTKNLNVVQFKQGTITLHNNSIPGPADIYDRIINHHKGIIPCVGWILWASFDVLIGSLVQHIDQAVLMVESIDQQSVPINPNERIDQSNLLRDISISRKRLGKLRNSFLSKLETLSILLTTEFKSTGYLNGIGHHLNAVESEAKWKLARVVSSSETLQAAYQNYLAFVSVQAANINNQANGVLKKITMLLAITSPLNLIASIFGMNVFPLTQVSIVGAGHEETYTLFVLLLVVMFVSSFALFGLGKFYRFL